MSESSKVGDPAKANTGAEERAVLMEALARVSLGLQGIPATEARISEIAVEAARLARDMSAHVGNLTYYDEPSHYAAPMRDEKADE